MHATILWRSLLSLLLAAVAASPLRLAFGRDGDRLTDHSREVRRAIDLGVKFLKSQIASMKPEHKALVGIELANYAKSTHADSDELNERILPQMAADIQRTLGNGGPAKVDLDIETSAWTIVVLAAIDSKKYAADLDHLLSHLERLQKPHGGWSPPDKHNGDMATTEMAVLCYFQGAMADRHFSVKSVEAATTWLLQTQDPGGGFGREGIVGDKGKLRKQNEVGLYSTAAGLVSLYRCAYILGMADDLFPHERDEDESTAEAESQDNDAHAKPKRKSPIDVQSVREALRRGNQWMAQNYKIDPKTVTCCELFTLARYENCRERFEEIDAPKPKWFSDGAKLLLARQNADGSWQSSRGKVPDTALALLFLTRSITKAIRHD